MLDNLLTDLSRAKILVAGDIMLDRYWYGDAERISPEAPVPVVKVTKKDERLGGAANVARNGIALGARCGLLGTYGNDHAADTLDNLIKEEGIHGHLLRDNLLSTTIKLRVIARQQQVVRIDFESPPSKDTSSQLLNDYTNILPDYDVVIISDYGKGGVSQARKMIAFAKEMGIPAIVDPKSEDFSIYEGADLITPNMKEFEQVAGKVYSNKDLEDKAISMLKRFNFAGILITRGHEGMSLIRPNDQAVHIPARAREVFDVTGAGDTVIATIGAAYAVGADAVDAMQLANVAAAIVVGKLGAETARPEEIRAELSL